MVEGMGAATAAAMAAVITAVDIVAAVVVTISAAGMAVAIFTAGRRISALSPGIVHSPHVVRSLPNA
jgi:hypothetical protein